MHHQPYYIQSNLYVHLIWKASFHETDSIFYSCLFFSQVFYVYISTGLVWVAALFLTALRVFMEKQVPYLKYQATIQCNSQSLDWVKGDGSWNQTEWIAKIWMECIMANVMVTISHHIQLSTQERGISILELKILPIDWNKRVFDSLLHCAMHQWIGQNNIDHINYEPACTLLNQAGELPALAMTERFIGPMWAHFESYHMDKTSHVVQGGTAEVSHKVNGLCECPPSRTS